MPAAPEPTTTCINTCNDQNNKCTYSDYLTFLNSKTTCRPVNQKTYKSYSSGGFKGSKGSPNSYLNSIPSKFCTNYANTTETTPYLRYSDLSKCCKFVCKNIISNTNTSCPPFSSSFTIDYAIQNALPGAINCPLNLPAPQNVSPIISPGTPLGGVWTISQPGVPGVNVLFTIDSSTGVITIPARLNPPSLFTGPEQGTYTVTYTVCGFLLIWSDDLGYC
uniref:Uncharacterized protein n=1 Tax=viral metagenome TaxID=1070528 RepID=A0A6C0EZV5_9ZZZZ